MRWWRRRGCHGFSTQYQACRQDGARLPAPVANPRCPSASLGQSLAFTAHLARKSAITGDLLAKFTSASGEKKLRDLWEVTELPAEEFAEEVARFFNLPRLSLPQLLDAPRWPHRSHPGSFAKWQFSRARSNLAPPTSSVVADPTDAASVRAAELTLGGPISIAIASFEDIATVLAERLGDDSFGRPESGETNSDQRTDDIDSLRDLASGAPVVRAE